MPKKIHSSPMCMPYQIVPMSTISEII